MSALHNDPGTSLNVHLTVYSNPRMVLDFQHNAPYPVIQCFDSWHTFTDFVHSWSEALVTSTLESTYHIKACAVSAHITNCTFIIIWKKGGKFHMRITVIIYSCTYSTNGIPKKKKKAILFKYIQFYTLNLRYSVFWGFKAKKNPTRLTLWQVETPA